jgi:hypothetical protein
MDTPNNRTDRNDLWFLTGFAIFLVACAAFGKVGSLTGSALTAVSLGTLLAAGWRSRRR